MIRVQGIRKSYRNAFVLDGVNLEIEACGVTSIIGPNGAGKSTLLAVMSRLIDTQGGTVTVDNMDVTKTPSDFLARKLSILRQENHISSRLTVRDLVSFGRYPYSHGRLTAEDQAKIDEAIAYLHLDALCDRFLDELSGGQRQRAYIAMVLCQDTDYMLFDEPLNNLDMRHAREMMQLLRQAAVDFGKTIVLVMHDINFAAWYSHRMIAMKGGRIAHHGRCDDLMQPDILTEIYDTPIGIHEINGKRISLHYE